MLLGSNVTLSRLSVLVQYITVVIFPNGDGSLGRDIFEKFNFKQCHFWVKTSLHFPTLSSQSKKKTNKFCEISRNAVEITENLQSHAYITWNAYAIARISSMLGCKKHFYPKWNSPWPSSILRSRRIQPRTKLTESCCPPPGVATSQV